MVRKTTFKILSTRADDERRISFDVVNYPNVVSRGDFVEISSVPGTDRTFSAEVLGVVHRVLPDADVFMMTCCIQLPAVEFEDLHNHVEKQLCLEWPLENHWKIWINDK